MQYEYYRVDSLGIDTHTLKIKGYCLRAYFNTLEESLYDKYWFSLTICNAGRPLLTLSF